MFHHFPKPSKFSPSITLAHTAYPSHVFESHLLHIPRSPHVRILCFLHVFRFASLTLPHYPLPRLVLALSTHHPISSFCHTSLAFGGQLHPLHITPHFLSPRRTSFLLLGVLRFPTRIFWVNLLASSLLYVLHLLHGRLRFYLRLFGLIYTFALPVHPAFGCIVAHTCHTGSPSMLLLFEFCFYQHLHSVLSLYPYGLSVDSLTPSVRTLVVHTHPPTPLFLYSLAFPPSAAVLVILQRSYSCYFVSASAFCQRYPLFPTGRVSGWVRLQSGMLPAHSAPLARAQASPPGPTGRPAAPFTA